ncbi:hypothetical protein ABTY20_18090 [Streptomyces sp. NPDC126497]|uniref:hypothetical protein n=1 Tax=Streptomyces sp. NPDC126497 TaxID=3155313 RepID=UPI003329CF94
MFVEVLVVGIGALVGVVGCVSAAAGYSNMREIAPIIASTPASGAALAFSYALGIVVDRAADYLLTSPRRRLRSRHFVSDAAYSQARHAIVETPHVVAMADYARSRMRICRGWFLNSVLLSVASALLIWRFPVQDRVLLLSVDVFLGLLCAAGFYAAWKNITATSYRKLAQQAMEVTARVPNQGTDMASNA